MGVMGILFFGFMDEEEATRPGNLLILVVLLAAGPALNRQDRKTVSLGQTLK